MIRTARTSILVPAAVVGVVAGLAAAVTGGSDGSPRPPTSTSPTPALATGPLRTARPDVVAPRGRLDRIPATDPRERGTRTRIVATARDPYGGPRWAVRTFTNTARTPSGTRSQTCSQVGRLLDGRFVWIDPQRRNALAVPVATTATTVCTGRSRAAVLGALRLPAARPGASNPQITATVVWGTTPKPRTSVAMRSPGQTLALPALGGGARLRVIRGDFPVGRQAVVADGRRVRYGLDNTPSPGPVYPRPAGGTDPQQTEDPGLATGMRVAAVLSDPSSTRPRLVATAVSGTNGRPCFAVVGSLAGSEPVQVVPALGALAPFTALCSTPPRVRPGRWASSGSSSSSQSEQVGAERQRAREYRTLLGTSGQTWAFPRSVRQVDLPDGLGERTVRTIPVGDVSIALVRRAGDLPFGTIGGPPDPTRVITGRDANGRAVALREDEPQGP